MSDDNVIHLDFAPKTKEAPPISPIELVILTQRHIAAAREAGFEKAVLYVGAKQLQPLMVTIRERIMADPSAPFKIEGVPVIEVALLDHYHFVPLP